MAKKKKGDDADDKKSNKTKMIVVAVIVALAGYKFVLAPKPSSAAKGTGTVAATKLVEGEVVPLPDLTLNLADPGDARYLRVGIALVLEKGTTAKAMKDELPIASDVAVDVLSTKTYAELIAPGAKQAMKAELSEKVRKAYDNKKVARVIFTSFVMQ